MGRPREPFARETRGCPGTRRRKAAENGSSAEGSKGRGWRTSRRCEEVYFGRRAARETTDGIRGSIWVAMLKVFDARLRARIKRLDDTSSVRCFFIRGLYEWAFGRMAIVILGILILARNFRLRNPCTSKQIRALTISPLILNEKTISNNRLRNSSIGEAKIYIQHPNTYLSATRIQHTSHTRRT